MANITETITFDITTPCDNPIYLRWKNRLGGWNYYLFDLKQLKTITIDSFNLFRENSKYIEDVRTVLNFYKKQGRRTWSLFAENITTNDVEILQELAISPKVEYYIGLQGSPSVETFETVLVIDYALDINTVKNRHNVTVQIQLLELPTLTNL